MTTQTATKPPVPTKTPPPPAPTPSGTPAPATPAVTTSPTTRGGYSVTVQRARGVLRFVLIASLAAGILTSIVGFFAINRAVDSYRAIVDDSAVSADAAQAARSAVLAHHSAAADTLSLPEGTERDDARIRTENQWQIYQYHMRRFWQNQSDVQFGEFAVFSAADNATWRYRAEVDAVLAFSDAGEIDRAQATFLESHQMLVREVLPALNGMSNVKLESMEAAYANTNADVSQLRTVLFMVGGVAVVLLFAGFALTRWWLHYAWTWELVIASTITLALFIWFNFSLNYAATRVEVLVRSAYESIAGVQAVEAYVTQAEALESMAIFAPERSAAFLKDSGEYLFLAEQRLCGELACSNVPFGGATILSNVAVAGQDGQDKYGLPDVPLVTNAYANNFAGEASALTTLGESVRAYRAANARLLEELSTEQTPSVEQRTASRTAYETMRGAVTQEQSVVRAEFNNIYNTVTTWMEINFWLTGLFTVLAILGAFGLRRRRMSLFP